MNKAKLNFIIDALMFLGMTAIAGLGFLMKYVLLPGRESTITYGRRVELSFLGLNRHDWGAVHLYLGFLLLALLALHIFLHWNMIPGLYARLIANAGQRWRIALVYVVLAAALLLFPFFISPEVKDAGAGQGQRQGAHEEIRLEDLAFLTFRDGRGLTRLPTDNLTLESGFDFVAGGKFRP